MTTETKHTPGPLLLMDLSDAPFPRTILYVETADGAREVATVVRTDTAEGQANARLFAAAHALRQEIETTMQDINSCVDNARYWSLNQLLTHLVGVQSRQSTLLKRIESNRGE